MKVYTLITLFPEAIAPYFGSSILKRAQEAHTKKGSKPARKPVVRLQFEDPKQHTDPSLRVDDKPYAGGPGMVLRAEPVLKAFEAAVKKSKVPKTPQRTATIFLSPQGEQFTQSMAQELAAYDHVVFVCGRYEGVDARVRTILNAREVSVGPFVVTGGELPAALMVDAIARHVPGVLGDFASREDDRVASPDVYTRPETLVWKKKKYTVPEVLLSGHHAEIEKWRKEQREQRAHERT